MFLTMMNTPLWKYLRKCDNLLWLQWHQQAEGAEICLVYRQSNLCWSLLNQTKFWLLLHFSDWYGTKINFVWYQINFFYRKSVITIQIWSRLTRFRKMSLLCVSEDVFESASDMGTSARWHLYKMYHSDKLLSQDWRF